MSVYSQSFFLNFVGAGSTVIFTTPPVDTIILRDLEVFNGAGAPQDVLLTADVSGNSIILVKFPQLAITTHAQWQGRLVLHPNQAISLVAQTNYVHGALSGYRLVGP